MELLIKILLILTLLYTFYQDLKERKVYWFLFLIIGICCGVLYYKNTLSELFYMSVLINLIFVFIMLLVVYIYSKFKLKVKVSEAFGLGDLLVFIAFAFSFSTVSFLIVFVFSLIFSLALHLFLNRKSKFSTVPLAGYMSLFFTITYITFWSGLINSLYQV